jgi:hypothetical protein
MDLNSFVGDKRYCFATVNREITKEQRGHVISNQGNSLCRKNTEYSFFSGDPRTVIKIEFEKLVEGKYLCTVPVNYIAEIIVNGVSYKITDISKPTVIEKS